MIRPDFEQWRRREVARLLSLVEEESRYYQKIVANLPSGIVVLASGLQILGANRAFCQLLSVSSKDIQDKALSDVLPSSQVAQSAQRALRDGSSEGNVFVNLDLNGRQKTFRLAFIVIHPTEEDEPEQEDQLLVVLEDLSGLESWRRTAEEPLLGLGELLAYSDGVFWEAEPESLRLTFVTGATERALGYPAAQWTAEPDFWLRHIHPEDRQQVLTLTRLASRQSLPPQQVEYRMVALGGQTVWMKDVITSVSDPSGRTVRLRGFLRRQTHTGQAAGRTTPSLPISGQQMAVLGVGVPLLAGLLWLFRKSDR